MGIFSGKKKNIVDSQVVRVVEDDLIPDVLRQSMVEAIFTDANISQNLVANVLAGSWLNFERAYRYAKRGDYAYGLPDARVVSSSVTDNVIFDAISDEQNLTEADNLVIEYAYFLPLNNFHMAWKKLYEELNFDNEANTLIWAPQPDQTVYLERIRPVHITADGQEPEAKAMLNWDRMSIDGFLPDAVYASRDESWVNKEIIIVDASGEEGFWLDVVWVNTTEDAEGNVTKTVERDSKFYSLAQYSTDIEYFQARYSVNGMSGFWVYNPADKRHPHLDSLYSLPEQPSNKGEYFPFIIFRSAGVNLAAPEFENNVAYTSSVKLCDIIGLDYQEVSDQIHENENVDDIRQAAMLMAVPITTEDPIQLEYLHRYFSEIAKELPEGATKPRDFGDYIDETPGTSYALEIADADFNIRISFDRLRKRTINGRVGEEGIVGTYENALIEGFQEDFWEDNNEVQFNAGTRADNTIRVIRKQVAEGIVEEIEILNARMRYEIFEGEGVIGSFDDERLLVPLEYNLCQEFSTAKKEDLYHRSLHMVFNTHIVQEVKWYQTGAFKAFMIIVGVVIAIYDKGFTLKMMMQGLAAGGATAAAVVQFLTITLLKVIVFTELVTLGIRELVDAIGSEAATLLAIAAVVYGVYGQFSGTELIFQLSPMELINLASNMFERALQLEMSDLMGEFENFAEYREEQMELLESAQELLGDPLNIDPLLFVYREPYTLMGESPTSFFDRTVNNTNPGLLSIDFLQNFYDVSLTLPESLPS